MSVTLRSFILSLLLIIAAAIFYRWSAMQQTVPREEILERYPSFTAVGFSGDNFDADGRLIHHVEAQSVVYYKNRGLLNMVKPHGIYYNYPDPLSRRQEPWQLTADEGSMVMGQEAQLKGHVTMTPLFENPEITSAKTSYLHFDLEKNLITTSDKITITGPNFVNYGTGLKADLTEKKIYLGDPHARYEPD